ncbi:trypsin-like peptidase domain-containing protein [Desulfoprunum benzoelyticum]|uniref:Serine protease Do n=1 Tax=Desulfoprunum benzoelyticum TaxID=1506996 RepID=A0A840V2S9_9BACT|nr:trypsin-like peptidase domain-containing protein [Desulfoprunum benzoelyticum]MBB5348039.1 serine protease Do [Desulfoprunum benzoelyticum]MBM9531421.1 trypsin-like peptidase domain-containing protein [Desulfoprunum benzoelyticum]
MNMQTLLRPLLLTVLCLLFALRPAPAFSGETGGNTIAALAATAEAFNAVAERVRPAVVYIHVKKITEATDRDGAAGNFLDDPALQRFFGESADANDRDREARNTSYGHGSGFIINDRGAILTNAHVINHAAEITVRLGDRREFTATVIGLDKKSDVALIRIEADNLPVLPLGDSSTLKVGEWALAIGSPFEMVQTVTAGIISATGRSSVGISEYEDFIQTDAAINPGNSGGPLVDIHGRAIGINTAYLTQTGGYMGVGFAIPINMARTIAERLQQDGRMTRAWLGVGLRDLPPDRQPTAGDGAAVISRIDAGSPAARSGLQQGDVIVTINGITIAGAADLRNRIALSPPGSTATVGYRRDGRQRLVTVVLGEK